MSKAALADIDEIRRFNRAYTRKLGVLDESFLDTRFSLTEARVLHELSEGEKTASEIASALGLDAGYLSRMLDRFAKAKLISRSTSAEAYWFHSRASDTPPMRRWSCARAMPSAR